MDEWYLVLPHVNASLNGLALVLLVAGFLAVLNGRIEMHRNLMLTSFGVSVLFLASYLTYHAMAGSKKFPEDAPQAVRVTYLTILLTHIVLAALVPFLAIVTIYLGLRDRVEAHRRIARVTLPIWIYVSITGVVVYFMLYQWYG